MPLYSELLKKLNGYLLGLYDTFPPSFLKNGASNFSVILNRQTNTKKMTNRQVYKRSTEGVTPPFATHLYIS